MKKLNLLFTAILLMCCVGNAKAEEVAIDGIIYDVITKAKQATVISGDTKYSGDIVIPSEITYNNVTCSVTSIGERAFYFCTGLTSITIPNSVTSIGYEAFCGCWGLTSITIPNSVTSIGEEAFDYCSGLTSVTIPNSVTSIGDYAFSRCSGLKEVHVNDLAAWCSIDFGSSDANPLYYAHNLYLNNELITELVIPNGVTSIKKHAFENSDLTSVVIPNSVTSIGTEAFYGCSGLTSITIPNSVTSIGYWAFLGCTGLESIVVGPGNTKYDSRDNCNAIIETESNTLIKGCNNSVIPNSVTSIGDNAFRDCSGLTSITIPNSVTSIGGAAFMDCSGLTSITIPNSVTSIGSSAFANCENLAYVYCLATDVPATRYDWGDYYNPFKGSYPEYMTLHVPAASINNYKTTYPWSEFGTIVTLDGEIVEPEEPEVKICATPTISYNNGKLSFECETEGAEFTTDVTCSDINKFYDSEINFSATYNISVYATATGYDNSDTVNATLCWIECDCDADDNTDIINIPAKAVLVTSNNGTINISCSLEGENVAVYSSNAMFIGSTTIENGCASIRSGLSKGNIAIIKIGEKSIKVILN